MSIIIFLIVVEFQMVAESGSKTQDFKNQVLTTVSLQIKCLPFSKSRVGFNVHRMDLNKFPSLYVLPVCQHSWERGYNILHLSPPPSLYTGRVNLSRQDRREAILESGNMNWSSIQNKYWFDMDDLQCPRVMPVGFFGNLPFDVLWLPNEDATIR